MWAVITNDIKSFGRRTKTGGPEWCPCRKWLVWYRINKIITDIQLTLIEMPEKKKKCDKMTFLLVKISTYTVIAVLTTVVSRVSTLNVHTCASIIVNNRVIIEVITQFARMECTTKMTRHNRMAVFP